MSLKGARVKSVMIIVLQHVDVSKEIGLVLIKSQGQLHSCCTDKNGHVSAFFHFYVMEFFSFLKEVSPEQEFVLVLLVQPVIVFQVLRNDSMINSFLTKK